MSSRFIWLYSILLFVSTTIGQDQKYYSQYFSTENGLPSNSVKDIVQDNTGFIWIATDGGVIRYDGLTFHNYNDVLESSYVKDLYVSPDGGVYVVTDLELCLFTRDDNLYNHRVLIHGSTDASDSLMFYSKSTFLDSKNRLWIGETNNISMIFNNGFHKYKFDPLYYTQDYKRSYLFLEDVNRRIIASSWKGYLFYYDEFQDCYAKIKFPEEGSFFINALVTINNEIYLGTSAGLYKVNIDDYYKTASLEQVSDLEDISSVYKINDNEIFIGTYGRGLYRFTINERELSRIDEVTQEFINSILIDSNNSIWVTSDDGLFLLKEQLFREVDLPGVYSDRVPRYISHVRTYDDEVFFTAGFRLFAVSQNNDENISYRELYHSPRSGVEDYVLRKDGYWIAYQDGYLEYISLDRRILFQKKLENGIIGRLFLDKDGYLWAFGVVSKTVYKISEDFSIEEIKGEQTKHIYVEVIKQLDDGNIYIAGINDNYHYILYYNPKEKKFIPLECKNEGGKYSSAHVFDLDYNLQSNSILLATSNGLLEYKQGQIKNIFNNSALQNITARSVIWEERNVIWIGTDKGLFIANDSDYALYNRFDGLPSATLSARGLIKDKNNDIWVGTVSGLAYFNTNIPVLSPSSVPFILNTGIDEEDISGKDEFYTRTSFRFSYSNLDFPTNRTLYKTRILGVENEWTEATNTNSIFFTNFDEGDFTFQVIAKSPGKIWSEPVSYNFSVVPHWYARKFMFVVYSLISIILLWTVINYFQEYRFRSLNKKKAELANLVSIRTKELEEHRRVLENQKTELQELLNSRDRLFSIIAHDLRSPFHGLIGLGDLLIEDLHEFSLSEIEEIVMNFNSLTKNTYQLLENLLDWARIETREMQFHPEQISVESTIKDIVELAGMNAINKGVAIEANIPKDIYVYADKNMLSTVLRNIISNAVKFTKRNGHVKIESYKEGDISLIKISDDGIGMDKDTVDGLFRIQVKKPVLGTDGEKGTGLGLVLCKNLLEKNNGEIMVESKINEGSIFTIKLPNVKLG